MAAKKANLWGWLGLSVASVGAVAAGAHFAQEPLELARVATGFAAKQTCSCLHVSGRTLDNCMMDFPSAQREALTVTAEGDDVKASALFGLVSAQARNEAGFGCTMVK
jgi:hypothetical protein